MIGISGKIKSSSSQNSTLIPYKTDMGSDGNIMPIHIFKIFFPRAKTEKLAATKNKRIVLKCKTKEQFHN